MLIIFSLLVTVGALLEHSFDLGLSVLILLSLFLFLGIVIYFKSQPGIVLAFLFSTSLVLGYVTTMKIKPAQIELGNRAFVALVKSVDVGSDKITAVVTDQKDIDYRLTTNVDLWPGDKISVRGEVEKPADFLTANGRIFEYQKYLESRGVEAVVNFPTVKKLDDGGFSPARFFAKSQNHLMKIFREFINYPASEIVGGMVLGVQNDLSKDLKNLFLNTGVLHTLVLSGYNITLLAAVVAFLLRGFSVKARTIASIIFIVLLVGVSGAGVASLRAGIMGSLTLLSIVARRTYDPLRGLLISYLIFFFLSPLQIFNDPGFHLSFLATGAIILLYPKIEKHLIKTKNKFWRLVQSVALLSTFMPIIMLPYIMYFSGNFSLVSPVANILATFFVPAITIGGLVLVTVSLIPGIARVVGLLVGFVVLIFMKILEVLSVVPIWNTPLVSGWGVWIIYLTLGCIFYRKEITVYLERFRNLFGRRQSLSVIENH